MHQGLRRVSIDGGGNKGTGGHEVMGNSNQESDSYSLGSVCTCGNFAGFTLTLFLFLYIGV